MHLKKRYTEIDAFIHEMIIHEMIIQVMIIHEM